MNRAHRVFYDVVLCKIRIKFNKKLSYIGCNNVRLAQGAVKIYCKNLLSVHSEQADLNRKNVNLKNNDI